MTDHERFEVVLGELGWLILALGDLAEHVTVIGGQVVALEDLARGGSGLLEVSLPTGPRVGRGFSLDLDLLYDGDAGFQDERMPQVLRERGFERSGARWKKRVGEVWVFVDLLMPEGVEPPTQMVVARGAEIAARRVSRRLALAVNGGRAEIPVPDPVGFLALKLAAKETRPSEHKDCFDIFAYVSLFGTDLIDRSLGTSTDGPEIRRGLAEYFGATDAPGVEDVLSFAPTLEPTDRELIARGAVDLFEPLLDRPRLGE